MTTNGTTKTDETPIQKIASEGTARVEQMFGEFEKFEAQQQQRAVDMIDEGARLMKASVEYSMKLGEEWRKLALQANKQAMEMFSGAKWF